MYFKITQIPDVSLSKYASLSDTGVDGILERHQSFLRQWHRIAITGKMSLHLIIEYDPTRNKSQKIEIGFLVDFDEEDNDYSKLVQQAFDASPLSEFFDFFRKDEDIEKLENIKYDTISMLSKKEQFLVPSNDNEGSSFFYVVPMWEMQDKSRLYNMLKLMQSFDIKCQYRLDIYPDDLSLLLREKFKKPLTWLRNNSRPSIHINMIGERSETDNDPAASDALKQYEDFLSKLDTSPSFYAHISVFCDDERVGQILLEAAASEAIKEGYDKITSVKGNFSGLSLLKNIDRDLCCTKAPESLRLLPCVYTLEELDPFFRFPTLYDGESIEIPKETAPKLMSQNGVFLGHDKNGYEVYLPLNMLKKHMFVCGVPGAGKTNTMLRIASTLWKKNRIPFLVLEPAKKEYRELALFDIDELVVFSPNANTKFPLRINPFEFPIGLTLSEHIAALDAVFEGAFPLEPPTPFILDRSIENIYAAKGWNNDDINDGTKPYPTLTELYIQFKEELESTSYESDIKGNIRSVLEMRIGSLLRREMADMFDTETSSYTPEQWIKRPIIIELESLGEGPRNFVNLLICTIIREMLKVNPNGDKEKPVRHVIFIEEAHNLIAPVAQLPPGVSADPKISATAFIVKMLAEVRALREGIIIADQLPTAMAPEVIKNTNIKLVHRLTSQDDRGLVGSTMSASETQMEQLSTFFPGQSLIAYEGLLKPFELFVKELKEHGEKTPSDDELFDVLLKKDGFKKMLLREETYKIKILLSLFNEFEKMYKRTIDANVEYLNYVGNREQKFLLHTKKIKCINDCFSVVQKINSYVDIISRKAYLLNSNEFSRISATIVSSTNEKIEALKSDLFS